MSFTVAIITMIKSYICSKKTRTNILALIHPFLKDTYNL